MGTTQEGGLLGASLKNLNPSHEETRFGFEKLTPMFLKTTSDYKWFISLWFVVFHYKVSS